MRFSNLSAILLLASAPATVTAQTKPIDWDALSKEGQTILADYLRINTTNPPGNEAECIGFVRGLLEDAGCEVELYAKDPGRPNLVSRLRGSGDRAGGREPLRGDPRSGRAAWRL